MSSFSIFNTRRKNECTFEASQYKCDGNNYKEDNNATNFDLEVSCKGLLKRTKSKRSMSAKAIREYYGKKLLSRWLSHYSEEAKYDVEDRALLVTASSIHPEDPNSFEAIAKSNPWVLSTPLVVKPDQLIKRRGKAGLLGINLGWPAVVEWIKERINKECKVESVSGILDHFIVEPFVPHAQTDEYYICLQVLVFWLMFSYDCLLNTTSAELPVKRRDFILP